jgi:hypothetical protein
MAVLLEPVSWKRMGDAVENVRRRLMRAAAALDAAEVPYAVTGGNAVAAWVSRVDESAVRNTRDVDILLRREDLPAAIEAMQREGFIHRRIASLGKGGTLDVFLDGPDAKPRDAVHVVFANERVREDNELPSADVTESEAAPGFRLVSLQALVRMKLTAFRDKARMHLRDLAEVGLVDDELLSRLPTALRARMVTLMQDEE